MPDFTPQQEEAIKSINCNVAVSAGAGSGKTRVLVERFVHILQQSLQQPVPLKASDILAITFTRKAAGEMKERVYQTIQELITRDGEHDVYWQQQLVELERAQITTIHSLCNRILKDNPVEAGLDPSFILAEEFAGREYLEQCLISYVRRGLLQEEPGLETLTRVYGTSGLLAQLEVLVGRLEEIKSFGSLEEPYVKLLQQEPAGKARLCQLLEELVDRREELGKKTKGYQEVSLLAENLYQVEDGLQQQPTDYRAFDRYVKGLKKNGKLKDIIGEVKELQEKLLQLEVDRAVLPLVEAWEETLTGLATYLSQQKQQDDFVDFDDLESRALDLLKENVQVRKKYQDKYAHIMVDEFQDTNSRQQQLVYLLCGNSATELQGKKLFIVGDSKQSIYRFRGADVQVFAQVRRDIAAQGGKLITLPDNFRTVDSILSACNKVFPSLLGENREANVFFESLQAHRESQLKPVFLQVPYTKENAHLRTQLELDALVEHIHQRHQEGEPYGAMAILLSAMTRGEAVAEQLQQWGIPCKIVDGKGFYERQEVLDLLHLFQCLENKHRSLALIGVLRSPYFGLDDESITTLCLHRQEDCLWDGLQRVDPQLFSSGQGPLVVRAREVLAHLRQVASLSGLPELWQEVYSQLQLEAVLSRQHNGRAQLANGHKLRQLALAFAANQQGTLGAWLAYVARLRDSGAKETTANLQAEDAVTIMTIHKSKGLEFSTVYLPFLDRGERSDTDQIKFSPELGLGIKAVLDNGQLRESSVLLAIKEREAELERAEKQRQLYVAMTRAKDALILSGSFNVESKATGENWFRSLQELLTEQVAELRQWQKQEGEGAVGWQQKQLQLDEQLVEAIAPLPNYSHSGQYYFTPTALQTYLHCPRQYFYQREGLVGLTPEVEGGSGLGLSPAELGTLIHRALELYDGQQEEKAWNRALEDCRLVDSPATEAGRELFTAYIHSRLYPLGKKRLKETYFTYALGNLQLGCIVDCILVNEDGSLDIIDYKTGRPPAPGAVPLGYAYQMALYKEAVSRILQRPVREVALHFLQDLSQWQLPEGDAYLEEAKELCQRLAEQSQEEDYPCLLANCAYCPYNYLCPQK